MAQGRTDLEKKQSRLFKRLKNHVTYISNKARREFYAQFINENGNDQNRLFRAGNDQNRLFRATNDLLHPKDEVCFPDHSDDTSLANDIGNFFYKKVINIRKELDAVLIDQCDSSRLINDPMFGFNQSREKFEVLSTDMVSQLIRKSAKKSCPLDPMPTSLVVKSLNELLPVITCMINSSLSLGYFPSAWSNCIAIKFKTNK
jgi:hypothetical protein